MNPTPDSTPLTPDDPRVTAYALGEMTAEEKSAFEVEMGGNPAVATAVEEIRAFSGQLKDVLEDEPVEEPEKVIHRTSQSFWGFPHAYYFIGFAAAACLAVYIETRPLKPIAPTVVIHQVDLAGFKVIDAVQAPRPIATEGAMKVAVPEAQAVGGAQVAELAPFQVDRSAIPSKASMSGNAPATSNFDRLGEAQTLSAPAYTWSAGNNQDSFTAQPPAPALSIGSVGFGVDKGAEPPPDRGTVSLAAESTEIRGIGQSKSTVLAASAKRIERFVTLDQVKKQLAAGVLPGRGLVDLRKVVDSVDYAYPAVQPNVDFSLILQAAQEPWASDHVLVRIGFRGREDRFADQAVLHLTFDADRYESASIWGYKEKKDHGRSINIQVGRIPAGLERTVVVELVRRKDAAVGIGSLGAHLDYLVARAPRSTGLASDFSPIPFSQLDPDFRLFAGVFRFAEILNDRPTGSATAMRQVQDLALELPRALQTSSDLASLAGTAATLMNDSPLLNGENRRSLPLRHTSQL